MMKTQMLAIAVALSLPIAGHAQTTKELEKGANDTANVLTQ